MVGERARINTTPTIKLVATVRGDTWFVSVFLSATFFFSRSSQNKLYLDFGWLRFQGLSRYDIGVGQNLLNIHLCTIYDLRDRGMCIYSLEFINTTYRRLNFVCRSQ